MLDVGPKENTPSVTILNCQIKLDSCHNNPIKIKTRLGKGWFDVRVEGFRVKGY